MMITHIFSAYRMILNRRSLQKLHQLNAPRILTKWRKLSLIVFIHLYTLTLASGGMLSSGLSSFFKPREP